MLIFIQYSLKFKEPIRSQEILHSTNEETEKVGMSIFQKQDRSKRFSVTFKNAQCGYQEIRTIDIQLKRFQLRINGNE